MTPPQVSMYEVTPPSTVMDLILKKIQSLFVLNVYLWLYCIIRWSKQGRYLDNISIWGHCSHFWSKCWNFTPLGLHVQGFSPLVWHLFRRNMIMLCPECIFVVSLYYQMVQIRKFFGYYRYLWSFLVKMSGFDPRGLHVWGYPLLWN